MKRVLMIASVASMIDQFNMENINLLIKLGYKVDVACNFEQGSSVNQERVIKLKKNLEKKGVNTYHIPIPRKLLSIKEIVKSYKKIKRIIIKNKYSIIHCHSPIGGALTRLASIKYRKTIGVKVIYTAHGFHFFKGAPIKNWIIYYPIEHWLSRYTDVLLTINKEDYERASKSFKAKQVDYIPGVGIDLSNFNQYKINEKMKHKEINIPANSFIILSVGELNENKNHETLINTLAKLDKPNIYYLICGQGILDDHLKKIIKKLGLESQVRLLGFREDIAEIYMVSDIFCFPSYREGLSVALMEAMATGLPVICSDIRGNTDLIKEGSGGFLVSPQDEEGFVDAINKLYESENTRKKFGNYNLEEIKKYSITNVMKKMELIYKMREPEDK